MKMLFAAALAGLLVAQPAAAVTSLGDYDLYASGNVHISGGANGDIASGSFSNANGPTGTNYTSRTAATAALTAQATVLSDTFAGMATTGTFANLNGLGTLTGSQSGINVFTISAAQLSPLWKLAFAGQGNGAIVNITGTGSLTTSIQFDMGAITDPSKVILNFVDLDSVWFNGLNFKGSVLAPDAAVRIQGNTVAGSVIGKSIHAEGTFLGGTPFAGLSQSAASATPAVPEPTTWLTMIVGFGAMGMMMRRRRAAPVFGRLRAA